MGEFLLDHLWTLVVFCLIFGIAGYAFSLMIRKGPPRTDIGNNNDIPPDAPSHH